ncbi:Voltage-dependent calcium channel subunit alpha-2/delta-4, partial [Galemys pyrenaicus]
VGVQMRLEFLQRTFWAVTQQDLDCFVIDHNGFILISKRPQEMGRFLGEVDGALMTQLLSVRVFSQVTMYDYQAMCKPSSPRHNAAQPLVSPLPALLSATRWLVDELWLLLLEWSAWGSWHAGGGADAPPLLSVPPAHKHKKQDQLQPCDTEYPVFLHQAAIREANGIIECGACRKMFVMQQIPKSNLLLLVTDSICDCSVFPPVLQKATEVKYILAVLQDVRG